MGQKMHQCLLSTRLCVGSIFRQCTVSSCKHDMRMEVLLWGMESQAIKLGLMSLAVHVTIELT